MRSAAHRCADGRARRRRPACPAKRPPDGLLLPGQAEPALQENPGCSPVARVPAAVLQSSAESRWEVLSWRSGEMLSWRLAGTLLATSTPTSPSPSRSRGAERELK